MTEEIKICKTCSEPKPLSEYPFVTTRNMYIPHCKVCHRKRALEYAHKTYPVRGERKKQYAREYHIKNREKGLEQRRKNYKESNREEQLARRRKWYQDNKKRHAENRTVYEQNNKGRLRAARRKWENRRLSEDINYRLHKKISGRIREELKGVKKKTSRTEELLGCSIEELKVFIEGQFQEGMTWDNWAVNGWHIDHRIPVSWFNLENENCRKLAFSYKNLQPLWSEDNLQKKNFFSHKLAV